MASEYRATKQQKIKKEKGDDTDNHKRDEQTKMKENPSKVDNEKMIARGPSAKQRPIFNNQN